MKACPVCGTQMHCPLGMNWYCPNEDSHQIAEGEWLTEQQFADREVRGGSLAVELIFEIYRTLERGPLFTAEPGDFRTNFASAVIDAVNELKRGSDAGELLQSKNYRLEKGVKTRILKWFEENVRKSEKGLLFKNRAN